MDILFRRDNYRMNAYNILLKDYVCVCVCVNTYLHTYIHTYIHTCIYIHI